MQASGLPAATRLARVLQWLALASFGLLIVAIPFRAHLLVDSRRFGNIYGEYTGFLVYPSDVALIVTLALWGASKLLSQQPVRLGSPVLFVLIAALVALGALSAAASVDPLLSAYNAARLALLGALACYVADQVERLDQIAIPAAVQVAVQAVVGIGQFMRQSDLGLQALGEYALRPDQNGVSVIVSGGQRWLRAYGLSDHPNILGGCLAFGLLIVLAYALTARPAARLGLLPVIALGGTALFLTFSRAAWLACGAGALALGLFVLRNRAMLIRGAQLALGAALVALPFILSTSGLALARIPFTPESASSPIEQQSLGERSEVNQAAAQVFTGHPLLGVGIGALPEALRQEFPVFPDYYQPAHFTLLDAAAETGLFGAAVYTLLLAAPWLALLVQKDLRRWLWVAAACSALLAVTLVGFFDYYTWSLAPGRLWQFALWGLWAAALRRGGEGPYVA